MAQRNVRTSQAASKNIAANQRAMDAVVAEYRSSAKTEADLKAAQDKISQIQTSAVAKMQSEPSLGIPPSNANPFVNEGKNRPWFSSGTASKKVLWIAGAVFVLWFSRPIIVMLLRNRD
jgi:hypothetical protein